jgi:hypothetical protein
MSTVPEMATAVHHDIPLVAVVFNDRGFGNVRRAQQNTFGGRYIASDLVNPDFVKLAEAFGMRGQRVTDAQEPAVGAEQSGCELAWGPDADRHLKHLISLNFEGSRLAAYSHPAVRLRST